MICAEKARLVEEYAAAVSELLAATGKITYKAGVDLRETIAASETAHSKVAAAKRALSDHKAQHHCG